MSSVKLRSFGMWVCWLGVALALVFSAGAIGAGEWDTLIADLGLLVVAFLGIAVLTGDE